MINRLRTTSIRIISLISSLLIFSSCCVFPVMASEEAAISAFEPSYIDFLGHDSYTMKQDTITQTSNKPLFNMTQAGEIRYILGDGENRYTCDYFIACVYATYQPVSVRISNESIGEGTFIKSVGNYHYYKFNKAKTVTDNINFYITMPSAYRGTVGLDMLMGVCNDTIEISNVALSTWGLFKADGSYYKQQLFNEPVSIPYEYKKSYAMDNTTADPHAFYLSFKYTFDIPVADSFSFVFTSASTWDTQYDEGDLFNGGITLSDSNDIILQTLTYNAIDSISSSTVDGCTITIYTVNVDLRGLDLLGNSIIFTTNLSPQYPHYGTAADQDYNFYHFRLYSAGYKLHHDVSPWYLRMFSWIRGEFTLLKSHLNSLFSNLDTKLNVYFTNLRTAVSTGFTNLNTKLTTEFTNLKSKLTTEFTNLKNTINTALGVDHAKPDISDQEQDVQDSVDDMDKISGDLDNTQQEIEDLMPEMPSWESTGLVNFDTIVSSFIEQFRPVFLAIYENNIINQILTYTFLFALGGFILFGER